MAQAAALGARLEDQPELECFQVAHPAVHQLGRPAAGAKGEIALLDQGDAAATHRRITRDACSGNAAADDDIVERFGSQPF